jgi:NDP-sugar pyrophosphorylase family protein
VSRAAVILAGETGSKIAPMALPRPLLPVGDRAIVDIVLRQLRDTGFDEVIITAGRLAPLLRAVVRDGSRHGLHIRYLDEDQRADGLVDTFLLMHGDALTDLDYARLIAAHREAGDVLTIATAERELPADFGIVDLDARGSVSGYQAKPALRHRVDMGVYAVEPAALAYASPGADGGALVRALLDAGEPVGAYAHDGYWLDLGRRDDFELAQRAA